MRNFLENLKKSSAAVLALALVFVLSACQQDDKTYKIGVVGDVEREVWETVVEQLKDEGVNAELEVFTDYVKPNMALADGSIDMNAFQHMAFLCDFNVSNNENLVAVGYTYISPMAAYSEKIKSLNDLSDGAVIVIPDDPTNGGRALLLLQQAGVLKIDASAGLTPSVSDISENPKNLDIKEVPAAQVIKSVQDAEAVVCNTNYAVDADYNPFKDGIFVDTNNLDEVSSQYKNTMAVRAEDKDKEIVQKVVAAYQTAETEAKIKAVSDGADQKAWSDNDDINKDFELVLADAKAKAEQK